MPSRKQVIYTQLLRVGILPLRFLCSRAAHISAEEALNMREAFEIGWEQANFLHRVHVSILEPEYVNNDIEFINWAFPAHIDRLPGRIGADTAALMLEFYEGVPEHLHGELTWHPPPEFRQLASKTTAE